MFSLDTPNINLNQNSVYLMNYELERVLLLGQTASAVEEQLNITGSKAVITLFLIGSSAAGAV